MGYAYNKVCYTDSAAVLTAFKASFPVVDGTGFTTLSTASVSGIPLPGAISYTVNTLAFATGTVSSRSSSFLPAACSSEGLGQFQWPDVAFMMALVFLWAVGFRSGQGA